MMPRKTRVFVSLLASTLLVIWTAAPPGTLGFLLRSPIVLLNDLMSAVREAIMPVAPAVPQASSSPEPAPAPGLSNFAGAPASVSSGAAAPPEEVLPPPDDPLAPVEDVLTPLEPVLAPLEPIVDPVVQTLEPVVEPVQKAVEPVTDSVDKTLEPVTDAIGGSGGAP